LLIKVKISQLIRRFFTDGGKINSDLQDCQKNVDKLAKDINAKWWTKNRSKLIK